MKLNLKKCVDCGRLFSASDKVQQCQRCAGDERMVNKRVEEAVVLDGLTTVAEIAASIGVDAAAVKRVLSALPLIAEDVESDETCPRCGIRPTRIGKPYCPVCLMGIDADLREMAARVEQDRAQRDARPEARMRGLSVAQALHEKKRRTGHYRFNPVSPNVKGY